MSTAARLQQVWTITRLQLRRVFFSRRSFWVYLLALFPAVAFFGRAFETEFNRTRWASQATPAATLESVREGESEEDVLRRAGDPIRDWTYERNRRSDGEGDEESDAPIRNRNMMFFDGVQRWDLHFEDGVLLNKRSRFLIDFEEDRQIYAAFFQHYYLRLAIFFGCLGIFMNLFRGEMLDKTLHFWFLAPARREVLLAGKYLAGLIAAVTIFTIGPALCFGLLLWPQEPAQLQAFWPDPGVTHLLRYIAAAALGCLGYGSVFLAAGLLLRNPIVPAVLILFWEGINNFLPAALQKLSVLYYVRSICPVPAPLDPEAPLLVQLLVSPAEPPSPATAVFGLLAVTVLVLWAASRAVRRIEINYGTD